MKTILYISDVNSNEPIFHSQVLPHIDELRKSYRVILLGMSRDDDFDYDFKYHSIKGDMHIPISYITFLKNRSNLSKFLKNITIDTIFSRGFRGGLVGVFIKKYFYKNNIKLINDVRADILDEHSKSVINTNSFYFTSKYIFNNSDTAFFVSSFLEKKYKELFKFGGDSAICPTFVPDGKFVFSKSIRSDMRSSLNYKDDDVVLLYSGNMAWWQNVDIILQAFEQTSNNTLKLLILTRDSEIYNRIENSKKKDSILVESVSYSDIQNYYSAADFGLLIRDNIPTNICSAPTKFSEYLNSGLSIIATKIDSDYCKFLRDNSEDAYVIPQKEDLVDLFNKIKMPISRPSYQLNTLSKIVESQSPLL